MKEYLYWRWGLTPQDVFVTVAVVLLIAAIVFGFGMMYQHGYEAGIQYATEHLHG